MSDADKTTVQPSASEVAAGAPGSGFRMVEHTQVFRFTKPVCPYCGKRVLADIHETQKQDDGTWMITSLSVDCESEPDIDGPDWEDWWDAHSYDRCEKWHFLHERLIHWLSKHVRVIEEDTQNTGGVATRR